MLLYGEITWLGSREWLKLDAILLTALHDVSMQCDKIVPSHMDYGL